MKKQITIALFITLLLTSFGFILLFAQDSQTQDTPMPSQSPQDTPAATQQQAVTTVAEPEVEWLWGEVVSLDTNTKEMVVKYLDYETDTEKEINIGIDEKTTYENMKSPDEIKAQDTVSIDYIAAVDGKNIAKNISVEKNEGAEQAMPGENKEEPKATPGLE